MILPRLKARIDRKIIAWLETKPLHEQDQIDKAAETWRGTLRYSIDTFKRALRGQQ